MTRPAAARLQAAATARRACRLARDAIAAAKRHGWTSPAMAQDYATEALIANGFAPDVARDAAARAWLEQERNPT